MVATTTRRGRAIGCSVGVVLRFQGIGAARCAKRSHATLPGAQFHWNGLDSPIRRAVSSSASPQKGSAVVPTVDFAAIEANGGRFPAATAAAVRKRGCVVVRNTLDEATAVAMKRETQAYIARNAEYLTGYPPEQPQVWEVYWSKPQGRMRQHRHIQKTQTALNRLWHCRALPGNAGQVSPPPPPPSRHRIDSLPAPLNDKGPQKDRVLPEGPPNPTTRAGSPLLRHLGFKNVRAGFESGYLQIAHKDPGTHMYPSLSCAKVPVQAQGCHIGVCCPAHAPPPPNRGGWGFGQGSVLCCRLQGDGFVWGRGPMDNAVFKCRGGWIPHTPKKAWLSISYSHRVTEVMVGGGGRGGMK